MDITIDAQALKKALMIPKAVMPKGYATIAHGLRLVATGDSLTVEGTDIDRLVSTKVPAIVTTPGSIIVSIKDLDPLLKTKGSVQLLVSADTFGADTLQFVNGMTTTVKSLDADEWPKPWPSFDKAESFDLDMNHVAEVMVAASGDDARPILTGVLFTPDGEYVATDSYRLHIGYTHSGPKKSLLIPAGTLAQVIKATKASKTPVVVNLAYLPHPHAAGLFMVKITAGPSTWYCTTISGEFPNYKALIPKDYPAKLVVNKEALVAILTKLNGIAKKEEPAEFKVTEGVEHADVSHRNRETQAITTATLPAVWKGPDMHFAFTVIYLLGVVNACRENEVVIAGLDALKPFMVGESHTDGSRSLRLIMPVRMT